MNKTTGFERPGNTPSPSSSKSFSISLPFRRSKDSTEAAKKKMGLSEIKLKVELCFQDVDSTDADRLRYRIRSTREVQDLWMLRSDIHQLISRQISQHIAAERINALLPCFEQWIPTQSLIKI